MRTDLTNVALLAGLLAMSALASPAWAVMHPTLGRWTQRDPAGYADGMNAGEALRAKPGSHLDPFGEQAEASESTEPLRVNAGIFKVDMEILDEEVFFYAGVGGTVEFAPDAAECPRCKTIKLVQIARVWDNGDDSPIFHRIGDPRNHITTMLDEKRDIRRGFHVDHDIKVCKKGSPCSIYYLDNSPEKLKGKAHHGSNIDPEPVPATIYDAPGYPSDRGVDWTWDFETCARCDDDGTYLGCVFWGFRLASGVVAQQAMSVSEAPSPTFHEAIRRFLDYYPPVQQ